MSISNTKLEHRLKYEFNLWLGKEERNENG